ncbi:MAG: hypothetical protein Q9178_006027 [Gyalolechia marmorata]
MEVGPLAALMAGHANAPVFEWLVKIPGFEHLSDVQQGAVCASLDKLAYHPYKNTWHSSCADHSARQPKNAHSLDADALHARLESISSSATPDRLLSEPTTPSLPSTTPPPDSEAEEEEYRLLEQEARMHLEADGCPPCLPDDPKFLLHDPPVQFKRIISYWLDFQASYGGTLCAQWKDRMAFRKYQERNRKRYLRVKTLDELEEQIRERRRKYQLDGAVHLHPDPMQQGQLDTWTEFQDFHLQMQGELETELQKARDNLNAIRTKLETGDLSEFRGMFSSPADIAASRMWSYKGRSAYADRRLKSHQKILLPWIEEQRRILAAAQAASNDGAGAHNDQLDTIRRVPAPCRQKSTVKARSILKPHHSGISKPTAWKRVLRRQEKPRETQEVLASSGAPHCRATQTPDVQEGKARSAKPNRLLRPFRAQKVTKAGARQSNSKQAASSTKQLNTTNKTRLTHPRLAQHQLPPKTTTTKSGRKSRRPERLGYVSYR